jgi:opine dehydrogenase
MGRTIAVLGAGAGALTVGADLTLRGNRVALYEHPDFFANVQGVADQGGVHLTCEGSASGFARFERISSDLDATLRGAELVFIVVPAYGHRLFAEAAAPAVRDGQMVCFLGEPGGVLEFQLVRQRHRLRQQIVLGETNTLPYTAKIEAPGTVRSFLKKGGTIAATFPGRDTGRLLQTLGEFWPFLEPAQHVFETLLVNFNAIDHVPTYLLNFARIEGYNGEISFWQEGATPGVVRCIEAVDAEIRQLKRALGLNDRIVYREWLYRQGFVPTVPATTRDGILNPVFTKSRFKCGPDALKHRYLTEDVPYALVLIASIGDWVGVETPVIDGLVTLASTVAGTDYWAEGRTLAKLGVPKLPLPQLQRYLAEGEIGA